MSVIKPEKNRASFIQQFTSIIMHSGRLVALILKPLGQEATPHPNDYYLPDLTNYAESDCHIYVPANAENHYAYAITRQEWAPIPKKANIVLPLSYKDPQVIFNLSGYANRVKNAIIYAIENPEVNNIKLNGFSIGGATLVHALALTAEHYKNDPSKFNKITKIDIANTFSNIRDVLRFSEFKLLLSTTVLLPLAIIDIFWFGSINAITAFLGLTLTSLLLPISVLVKTLAFMSSWTIGLILPKVTDRLFRLAGYLSSPYVDAILARYGDDGFNAQESLLKIAESEQLREKITVTQILDDITIAKSARLINESMQQKLAKLIRINIIETGGHLAGRANQYK